MTGSRPAVAGEPPATADEPAEAVAAVRPDDRSHRRWWQRPGSDTWVATGLGAVALALYGRTLLPGVGYSGDTAKWQFIGEVGGVPHPTGYPLYLIVNRAFVNLVPFGSLAWRANLLSAVLGAATVATLFLLLRTLGVRTVVAAVTAATFATTVSFWSQAVVAEVYTLHLWLLAVVTLCLARWLAGASDRWLVAGIGLYALSFGNHLGAVLALPGVAWLVWRGRERAFRWRNLGWLALFVAVGAGQYAYLLWMTRAGGYVEYQVRTLGDIVYMVRGGPFRHQMFAFGWDELMDVRIPMFNELVREELGLLLLPAGYGIVRGLRGDQRAVSVHLLLFGVLAAAYALEYDVLDIWVFFLPCYLVLAVFLGLGLDGLAGHLRRWVPDRRALAAGAAGLAVLPLALAAAHMDTVDQSHDVADAERIERALAVAEPGSVLLTDNYADSEYFWYYLLGEGLAEERDLALANMVPPARVVRYLERGSGPLRALAGREDAPVYTITPAQALVLAGAGLSVTEVATGVWRVGRDDAGDR